MSVDIAFVFSWWYCSDVNKVVLSRMLVCVGVFRISDFCFATSFRTSSAALRVFSSYFSTGCWALLACCRWCFLLFFCYRLDIVSVVAVGVDGAGVSSPQVACKKEGGWKRRGGGNMRDVLIAGM